jgi:hypothetical protein
MDYVVIFTEGDQAFEMDAPSLDAARAIAQSLKVANASDVTIAVRSPAAGRLAGTDGETGPG